ncbi:hypothetical protein DEFDS_0879 [Deferribacter desulfuricans SSM1]|uniref:Uncharacterized protein n=1 Tax=Deferribacter desulfuricans (strain DSM 14783 / JCM 11476 / NBRC 101012 / SSM1) TaxID=639282 RepID=D3PCN2_DEFDS|nr:hypothetical protein DEFDS_0879 [Deferribacter desulfuricans SSM1]
MRISNIIDIKFFMHYILFIFNNGVHRINNNGVVILIPKNINSDKMLKRIIFHVKPRLSYFLSPKSYLPFDSGFEAKSTNGDFWDGGQTPNEALKLRKHVVLCPLFFINLIIYLSNIKYKYHNYS